MALSLIRQGVPLSVGGVNPITPAILETEPANLVLYPPLDDSAGSSTARDLSGNNFTGTVISATPGAIAAPGGVGTAYLFDGLNDEVDFLQAGLIAAFDPAKGTILGFGRVLNSGIWTDGVNRNFATFGINVNNSITFGKSVTNNNVRGRHFDGSAALVETAETTTDWFCLALTYSSGANQIELFLNGTSGGTAAGIISVGSPLDSVLVGSFRGIGGFFSGYLAHLAYWTKVLTQPQIQAISDAGGV
jgi:hypothetical protein